MGARLKAFDMDNTVLMSAAETHFNNVSILLLFPVSIKSIAFTLISYINKWQFFTYEFSVPVAENAFLWYMQYSLIMRVFCMVYILIQRFQDVLWCT